MTRDLLPSRVPVFVLAAICVATLGGCKRGPELEVVAEFPNRQPTGVAISNDGRIFVNFPRWSQSHEVSVVELLDDGTTRPYPNEQWNQWNDSDHASERFVCIQSVTCDSDESSASLWILDSGNPAFGGVVPNAAKLVQVDLQTDRVVRVIRFDSKIVPKESYLNDIRVDSKRGFAYITDSGLGALVVVNLNNGRSRRVLDGHRSTTAERDCAPVIGQAPWRDANGQTPQVHADGIALSADRESLYFTPLAGRNLYRLSTVKLRNFSLGDGKIAAAVESLGEIPLCDGMASDKLSRLYLTALEQDAIVRRNADGTLHTVVSDPRIRWPDSLVITAEGDLYFTISQIHLTPRFNKGQNRRTEPYALFKVSGVVPQQN